MRLRRLPHTDYLRLAAADGIFLPLAGKLIAVSNILSQIKATTDEKVVIVSNFTKVRLQPSPPLTRQPTD